MTVKSVTVPARFVRFGDDWHGSIVTAIVNSWRPENIDITMNDPIALTTRTVTMNRDQNISVQRNVV